MNHRPHSPSQHVMLYITRILTLSSSLQISYLPLAAASWSGVNFHKSATLTEAPCLTSSSATS